MTANQNNNVASAVQNYIINIQAQYAAAETYISQIQSDSKQIADNSSNYHYLKSHFTACSGATARLSEMSTDLRDNTELAVTISTDEVQLQKFDPGFTELDTAINDLLSAVQSLQGQNADNLFSSDLQTIRGYFNQIFTAMYDQLQADKHQAPIQNDRHGNLSDAQIKQIEAFAANITANQNNNNVASVVQNYINNIQAQYKAAEAYISEIQSDANEMEQNSEQQHYWSQNDKNYYNNVGQNGTYCSWTTSNGTAVRNMLDYGVANLRLNADIKEAEGKLQALDPGFTALDNTINGLLSAVQSLQGQNVGNLFSSDLQKIQGYLSQVFTAMDDKLQADKYQALIQNDKQGNLSDAQIEAFAAKMIGYQSAEQNVLTNLIDSMTNDRLSYNTAYANANGDKHSYNIFETFFDWDGADEKIESYTQIINNANAMSSAILAAIGNLSPEISSLMPEFTQLQVVIEEVIRKVMKIVSDASLSSKEKSADILALMMFLLGFFNVVQQDAEGQKAQNQKMMAEANLDAAKMNLEISAMNQKIQAEEAENAKIMGMVMFVAQVVMGAIFTALAPGVGSALVMAALTIASTSGGPNGQSLTDKLTTAIANATGQTWAEVIVTAMEIVLTAGGGAALDMLASNAASAVAKTAVTAAEQGMAETIVKGVEEAGAKGLDTVAARATFEKVAKQAADKGAQHAYLQFQRQSIASQIQMVVKGTYSTLLKKAVDEAALEAAQIAVKDAAETMEATGVANLEANNIKFIASSAAKGAVSKISNTSPGIVDKGLKRLGFSDYMDRSVAKRIAMATVGRSIAAGIYGITSNNLLLQFVLAAAKKAGMKEDSNAFEQLQVAMQIIQGLIAMFAEVAGSGMLATSVFEGSPQAFARVGALGQTASQGASSIANLGMYGVDESQADAEKGLTIAQTIAELLQQNLEQMNTASNLELTRFLQQQKQLQQSNNSMASHLHDGDNAGIQVLTEQAV